MNKSFYKLATLFAVAFMFVCSAGAAFAKTAPKKSNGSWAIYLYVCGSDLESDGGLATDNLLELMNTKRSEDTIIVAQTGGASNWDNNFVNAKKTQRWLFTPGDMDLVYEGRRSNMGESKTLSDFLSFASTNYPADHTMVVLWDHGGGTLGGCCIDENYDDDALSLQEIHDAFKSVYGLSENNPPIDILGFDCCLMATLDVADTFKDTAHYLVASEELEPGCGWNYASIGNGLLRNPKMGAEELGKLICDSYYKGVQEKDEADSATLSLTDLGKVGKLKDAFSRFVDQMIIKAYNNPECFKEYAITAKGSENYGGNSRAEGYTDLTDIKNFVEQSGAYVNGSDAVLKALNDCVLYKVNGNFRTYGGGLSFYYDYDGWDVKNKEYKENGTIDALKTLYTFGVSGKLDGDGRSYMKNLGLNPDALPAVKTFENYNFNGTPIQYNQDGKAFTCFGSDVSTCITDAMYNFYAFKDGKTYYLGSDDEVNGNYDTGVITDDMGCKWGFMNGNLAFMELTYDSDDYNLYSIPVLVDGDKLYLQVGFDYKTRKWEMLGAREPDSQSAMTASRLEFLDKGKEVTLLEYVVDKNGDLKEREGATFRYDPDDSFDYKTLEDGRYAMEFVIEDIYTNQAVSDSFCFNVKNGQKTYER